MQHTVTKFNRVFSNALIISFVLSALLHDIHFSNDWNFKSLKDLYELCKLRICCFHTWRTKVGCGSGALQQDYA